ncbi:hypothetical protein B0H14DRAFT_2640820 [Mycena olivaceomarginata]|nr:hypothetical protein B0H14DRAFT_2640820 [Mycena olivaceomarginata]
MVDCYSPGSEPRVIVEHPVSRPPRGATQSILPAGRAPVESSRIQLALSNFDAEVSRQPSRDQDDHPAVQNNRCRLRCIGQSREWIGDRGVWKTLGELGIKSGPFEEDTGSSTVGDAGVIGADLGAGVGGVDICEGTGGGLNGGGGWGGISWSPAEGSPSFQDGKRKAQKMALTSVKISINLEERLMGGFVAGRWGGREDREIREGVPYERALSG